jgi:DNA-binding CsgD family transcriptional regulator
VVQAIGNPAAVILRDAQKDLAYQITVAHWDFYRAFRQWMARITRVDAFYIGLFHGMDRILYPYQFDGNDIDDEPGSLSVMPGGVSEWVRERRRTYRYSFDDGAVLKQSKPFGDVTRSSADVLAAPLFRAPSDTLEVFGVASVQTYTPNTYTDEDVAAFEWLCSVVARLLTREEEDRQSAAVLEDSAGIPPDEIISAVVRDLGLMRRRIDAILNQPAITDREYRATLEHLGAETARLQAETAELVLRAHRAAETRFRSLTKREQDVALLLMKDLSNAEIATSLGLSERTVKVHVGNVLKKYAAKQRSSVIDELRRYLG